MKKVLKYLGWIITNIALVLGVWDWYNGSRISELSFEYKTDCLNDYLDLSSYSSDIHFNVNGKNYKSIYISAIKIENIGNSDIRKDDYDNQPIKFYLSKNVNIIEIKNKVSSENFTPDISFFGDTIFIKPILFKKRAFISFDMICQSSLSNVKSLSSIAGLDLISTNGHKYMPKVKSKVGGIIDNLILYISFGFYIFLFFTLFLGRTTDSPLGSSPKPRLLLSYRPNNRYYSIIQQIVSIMALLCLLRIIWADYTMIYFIVSLGLGMNLYLIFSFNTVAVLQPFKGLNKEEIIEQWKSKRK